MDPGRIFPTSGRDSRASSKRKSTRRGRHCPKVQYTDSPYGKINRDITEVRPIKIRGGHIFERAQDKEDGTESGPIIGDHRDLTFPQLKAWMEVTMTDALLNHPMRRQVTEKLGKDDLLGAVDSKVKNWADGNQELCSQHLHRAATERHTKTQ